MNSNRKKVVLKTALQLRAEEVKGLIEQRAEKVQEMKELTEKAETEKRAFAEEEDKRFEELDKEVKALDSTIEKLERAKAIKLERGTKESNKEDNSEKEAEERAFANYIRRACGAEELEVRAGEKNLTMGETGAIIPTTIANRIITTVKEMCPILQKATMYNVKGTLKVPVWGASKDGHDISVGWQEEFTELTADTGEFTSIDLSGYLAGALSLIGKSVANNASIDVVSFIVGEMSKKIALFIERELLYGSSGKTEGALGTKTVKETASAVAITADELIDTQASIKQIYQNNACWVMNHDTFTAIRKLKDANGRYLLQDDFTGEFPYRMLGKPVYLSDNMEKMAAGGKIVLYGDFSGLSVNMRENVQIQILQEKYATQHAIGIVSWFEFDSKITEHEKLAVLKMKKA